MTQTVLERWRSAPRSTVRRYAREEFESQVGRVLPDPDNASSSQITSARRALARNDSDVLGAWNQRVASRASTTYAGIGKTGRQSGGFLGALKAAGGKALKIFEELDRPLTDRVGFDLGDNPVANVGDFILDELTRPTNLLVAAGGAGAASRVAALGARGGRVGSLAGRGVGALIDPITSAPGFGGRLAVESAASGAGRIGADLGQRSGVPGGGIVGGLLGGVGGATVGARTVAGGARGAAAGRSLADQALLAQGMSAEGNGTLATIRQRLAQGPARRELEARGLAQQAGGALDDLDPGAGQPLRLYRGDVQPVEAFSVDKTSPTGLFGRGVYLTDNPEVARTYTTKGADGAQIAGKRFVGFGTSPEDAIDSLADSELRSLANTRLKANVEGTLERELGRPPTSQEVLERVKDDVIYSRIGKPGEFEVIDRGVSGSQGRLYEFVNKSAYTGEVTEVRLPRSIDASVINAEAAVDDDVAAAIEDVARQFKLDDGQRSGIEAVLSRIEDSESYYGTPDAGVRDLFNVTTTNGNYGAQVEGLIGERGDFGTIYEFIANEVGPDDWPAFEEALRRRLQAAGYEGIRYDGGARLNSDVKHNAYVLWDVDGINRRRVPRNKTGAGPIGGGSQLAFGLQPTPLMERLYGAQPIELGLTKGEEVGNHVKGMLGIGVKANEIATPALKERKRLRQNASSLANVIGTQVRTEIDKVFKFADDGLRIEGFEGAVPAGPVRAGEPRILAKPTLQDVAARYPLYEPLLDDTQRAFMENLRDSLKPFKAVLQEQGIELHSRQDVMEGGFYLPRGSALNEAGAELPSAVRAGGGRAGSKQGFERAARFDSMAEGIEKGYVYPHPGEAVQDYLKDVGNRAIDAHTANYFKTVRDPVTGELLGELPSARILRQNPKLARDVQALQRRLEGLRGANVRLADKTDASIEAFINSPAPDLDDLADAMALFDLEEVIVTPAFRTDELPAVGELNRAISNLAGQIEYTKSGGVSRSKANIARMRQTGELEALRDVREIVDNAPTAFDALTDIEDYARRLSEDVGARSDRLASRGKRGQAYRGRANYEFNFGSSRTVEYDVLVAREQTMSRVLEDVDVDVVKGQPQNADVIVEKMTNTIRRTAERLQVKVGRSATGKAGRNFGMTRKDVQAEMKAIRGELATLREGAWGHAKRIAAQTPQSAGGINFAQLSGRAYPLELANAANTVLNSERRAVGRGAGALDAIEALNTLLRGIRATADASFLGIQGLVGLAVNPRGYGRAVKVAYQAMADPATAGAAIRDFNDRELARGLLSAEDWTKYGLHQGGRDTEFAIQSSGRSVIGRTVDAIGKAPIVRQSNEGFGQFGDAMRREQASTFLEIELGKSGRTVKDLSEEELRGIARAANLGTGWGPNKFGGTWGDFAMFAPRFFQSQLDLVADAVTKGDISGDLARRSLIRLLGTGAALTIGANVALGNEQNLSPITISNGSLRVDPNFMRVRLAGRDYSVFGPWDSLIKAAAGAVVSTSQGKPFDAVGYLARTKSSPVLGLAWDTLTGKTFMGDDAYDPRKPHENLKQLGLMFTPFSLQDIPELAGDVRSGNFGSAAGGLVAEVSGLKSTPLSPTEDLDNAAKRAYGVGFYDLEPYQREAIKAANPDVWARAVERGSEQRQEAEEVRSKVYEAQLTDDQKLISGTLKREQWRDERDTRRDQQRALLENVYGDSSSRSNREPSNEYERYLSIIDHHSTNDGVDWDAVDLEVAMLSPEQQEEIKQSVGVGQTPLSKAYQQLVSPYYDIPRYTGFSTSQSREIDDTWQEVINRGGEHELGRLRALREFDGQIDPAVMRALKFRILGKPVSRNPERDAFRRENPILDVLLGNGRLTPADQGVLSRFIEAPGQAA